MMIVIATKASDPVMPGDRGVNTLFPICGKLLLKLAQDLRFEPLLRHGGERIGE